VSSLSARKTAKKNREIIAPKDMVAFSDSTNATVLDGSLDPVIVLGGGGMLVADMDAKGGL
jgi:hypothetical protein